MTKDSAQIMSFNPTLDAAEAEALAEELGDRFVNAREEIPQFFDCQKGRCGEWGEISAHDV